MHFIFYGEENAGSLGSFRATEAWWWLEQTCHTVFLLTFKAFAVRSTAPEGGIIGLLFAFLQKRTEIHCT